MIFNDSWTKRPNKQSFYADDRIILLLFLFTTKLLGYDFAERRINSAREVFMWKLHIAISWKQTAKGKNENWDPMKEKERKCCCASEQ